MAFGDLFRPAAMPVGEGEVSVSDALMKLSQGGVLLDVRSASDYALGHIPGARLADLQALQENAEAAIWGGDPLAETDKPVIVVSLTPQHAGAVAHLLRDKGIDAWSLAGGLSAWAADGQPLIQGPPR